MKIYKYESEKWDTHITHCSWIRHAAKCNVTLLNDIGRRRSLLCTGFNDASTPTKFKRNVCKHVQSSMKWTQMTYTCLVFGSKPLRRGPFWPCSLTSHFPLYQAQWNQSCNKTIRFSQGNCNNRSVGIQFILLFQQFLHLSEFCIFCWSCAAYVSV